MTTTDHSPPVASPAHAPSAEMRRVGIALAGLTAVISGFSVFINSYGVKRFDDSTTYTTAKNLVAAVVVSTVLIAWRRTPRSATRPASAGGITPTRDRLSLAAIAVIGGSVPFVLFFEGLARVSSTDAAFIHKTMVAWVAVLGVVLLKERLSAAHYLAIAFIMLGYAIVAGGVGIPEAGDGELMILAATLCWSVEVVLARSLLRRGVSVLAVGTWRMAGGALVLLGWALLRGALGELFALSAEQWRWALITGLFLSGYVISWHHALARAQAVDVTAMLVIGAVITALLDAGFRNLPVEIGGLILLGLGGLIVASNGLRSRPSVRFA